MKHAEKIASPITFTAKDHVQLEDIGSLVNLHVFINTLTVNYYATDYYNDEDDYYYNLDELFIVREFKNYKKISLFIGFFLWGF